MPKQTKANFLSLGSRAVSSAARSLVDELDRRVSAWEAKTNKKTYGRRGKMAAKFRNALERLSGDLLRAAGDDETPWLFRSKKKDSFTGDVVTATDFKAAMDAMVALGLIAHRPGKPRYVEAFGAPFQEQGMASTYSATNKLLALAREFKIHPSNIDEHFRIELPREPLVLRAASLSRGGRKSRGKRILFKPTKDTERLVARLKELNTFLDGGALTGGVHYGYVKIFNEGDLHRPYKWNKGGRLFSMPAEKSYQQLPSSERAKITINGEHVCEIDIRACNLTIFHAKLGVPLDTSKDPYARIGVERELVKAWTTASIGSGAPKMQWSAEMTRDYLEAHKKRPRDVCKVSEVAHEMLAVYPALKRLGDKGVEWADLMYTESEVILGTMVHLMHLDIPSLSVHNLIIVPLSKAETAAKFLLDHFSHATGVFPGLSTKSKRPGAREAVQRAMDSIGRGERYSRPT